MDLFDPNRRFLFGYSNGAMLAHRLVSQMPDHWAALWAMSGTCGGKSNVGLGSDGAVNLPEDGRYAVSLFAHHGDKDTTVPPGDWGADDFDYQAPQFPDKGYLMYAIAGFPSALDYRPGYLPLSQASRGYRTYNTLEGQSPFRDRVGLGGASTARSKSWPNGENPDGHNPTVVIYRDSEMDHTNFTKNESKRYFFEKDVWRFFNRHHRTIRPPSHEPAPIEIAQAVSVKTNAEAPSMSPKPTLRPEGPNTHSPRPVLTVRACAFFGVEQSAAARINGDSLPLTLRRPLATGCERRRRRLWLPGTLPPATMVSLASDAAAQRSRYVVIARLASPAITEY